MDVENIIQQMSIASTTDGYSLFPRDLNNINFVITNTVEFLLNNTAPEEPNTLLQLNEVISNTYLLIIE